LDSISKGDFYVSQCLTKEITVKHQRIGSVTRVEFWC